MNIFTKRNTENNVEIHKKIKEPFDFKYSKLVIKNDFKQIRGNKEIFYGMIFIPILFSIGMPFLMGLTAIMDPDSLIEETGLTIYEAINIYLVNMTLKPMFLLIPGIVSMMIVSDSFAGEKERKTAETILALPMTHRELYIGKMITALIPSLIFSYLSFLIMGLVFNITAGSQIPDGAPLFIFGDPSFWLIAFVLSTLISLVNIQAGLMISARARDVKAAQSLTGTTLIPLLGILFAGMFKPDLLGNIWIVLIICGIVGLVVYIMTVIGSKLINRERLVANLT